MQASNFGHFAIEIYKFLYIWVTDRKVGTNWHQYADRWLRTTTRACDARFVTLRVCQTIFYIIAVIASLFQDECLYVFHLKFSTAATSSSHYSSHKPHNAGRRLVLGGDGPYYKVQCAFV